MSRRKEIFKDAGIYTLSSYVGQFFDVINGILVRRFLGPTNMGIWAFLQVIQNYAKHAGLGITTATARDVPYFLGKGDKAQAEKIQNLVFSFTILTALMVSIGIVIFAYVNRFRYSEPIYHGLFVIAALILLQRIYSLFVVLLRAYKEFIFAGILNTASSVTGLICTIVLTWKFQLYGYFASMILNYVLMIAIILWRTTYRFSFHLEWKPLVSLLSLGISMVVSDVLRSVLVSIDRIMIAKFMGFAALGYYSVALMAGNYLYTLPNMLSVIFFPHFQEAYAKRDSAHDLEKFLRVPTLCFAYLLPFLIGFVWIMSMWIIPILLPQYTSGIPALKYYILGAFFLALTTTYWDFMITIKKHWTLIPLQGFAIAFGFGITWLFIRLDWGIEGVAVADVLTCLVQFLILSFMSLRQIHKPKTMMVLYLKVFAAFCALLFALWISDHLFMSWPASLIKFAVQFLAFMVLLSPLLWLAEKEAGVLTTLRHLLADFWAKRRRSREEIK